MLSISQYHGAQEKFHEIDHDDIDHDDFATYLSAIISSRNF